MKQRKIYAEVLEQGALDQFNETMAQDFVMKGALMADSHTGYVMPIGGVVATKDVVIPAYVGYDIGCFTGDTLVRLTDNRTLSFIDLVKEYEKGKINYIYTIKNNGKVGIEKVFNPRITKQVKSLIEITLDDDSKIECTLEHEFMLRDGNYIEAQYLEENMSLMPLYIHKAKDVDQNDIIKYSKQNKNGALSEYLVIYNPRENAYQYIHQLADEMNPDICDIKNYVRHHKDFNKYNNNPSNIQRLKSKDHFKIHSNHAKILADEGKIGFKLIIKNNPNFCSESGSLPQKPYSKSILNKKKEIGANIFRKLNKNKDSGIVKNWKDAGSRGKKHLLNTDEDYKIKQKLGKIYKILLLIHTDGKRIDKKNYLIYRKNVYNGFSYEVAMEIVNKKYRTLSEFFKEYSKIKNHKVKAIKRIDLKKEIDVYCMTVPDTHNFALASGVFVHNCGMCAAKVDVVPDDIDLPALFEKIKAVVPVGRNQFAEKQDVPVAVSEVIQAGLDKKGYYQLGSLGSGNHFIEIGVGNDGKMWIVIHSGSRNLGHFVAEHYMKLAKSLSFNSKEVADAFKKRNIEFLKHNPKGYVVALEKHIKKAALADSKSIEGHFGLHVDSDEGKAYIRDMEYCLEYALENRKKMIEAVIKEMGNPDQLDFINRNHNHAEMKDGLWIHRKGATQAEKGMKGVIPGNMRDGSFIVSGMGNKESLYSSSHGAGRVLSRKKANEILKLEDFVDTMAEAGVIGTIDKERLDEAPDAYKDIHDVISIQEKAGLIKVLDWVRPLVNVKG